MNNKDYADGQNNGIIIGMSLGGAGGGGGDSYPAPTLDPPPGTYHNKIRVRAIPAITEGSDVSQYIGTHGSNQASFRQGTAPNAINLFGDSDVETVSAFYLISGKASALAIGEYIYDLFRIKATEPLAFSRFALGESCRTRGLGQKSSKTETLAFPAFTLNDEGEIYV